MLVEAPPELGIPGLQNPEVMRDIISGSDPINRISSHGARLQLPRVRIGLPNAQAVEGPYMLHPNRQPEKLFVSKKKQSLALPVGATVWMRVDGHEIMVTDSTSRYEAGSRGVIITQGKLRHEVRHETRKRRGNDVHLERHRYTMATYGWGSVKDESEILNLREGEEKEIAGVNISYAEADLTPNIGAEVKQGNFAQVA